MSRTRSRLDALSADVLAPGRRDTGGIAETSEGSLRMYSLEIENLTKRYGHDVVVDDLSFTVQPGRVTGFLGPNGAGKSTT
ncbi:MAG TPA: ATP-binding cassette domain-containing protein, partial [Jiangellales bacterium]|nr:ATP-binding cassette domain-containing protein [Jiangellales bacterium]